MAKGYSVRYAENYTHNSKGGWKLHSSAEWDSKGYTKIYPTIERAKDAAVDLMNYRNSTRTADDAGYIVYCKIYLGKEYIETVTNVQ